MPDINFELLTNDNYDFVAQMACRYSKSRASVAPSWRLFFDKMASDLEAYVVEAKRNGLYESYIGGIAEVDEKAVSDLAELQLNMTRAAFRDNGHLSAHLDALEAGPPPLSSALSSATLGFAEKRIVDTHAAMRDTYCGTLALEAGHVEAQVYRSWLYQAFESGRFAPHSERRLDVLDDLIRADTLETFCQKKHPSVKRFGAEGAEAMIPLINQLLAQSAALGIDRVVIGGMHRGRLNVLAHVAGKPLSELFSRFLDLPQVEEAAGYRGDVLYHIGHDGTRCFNGKAVHLSLLPHPSHLLAVAAVALGRARAEQLDAPSGSAQTLPIMMHTDAAFAGQGLTSELLQMGGLDGFSVGGAVHVVINNHVGFTTSEKEGRRTRYCTDIAKAYGIPVLHVNGSDPDAVATCAAIASAYRQEFQADIVIDFNCYRRRGHNEIDEPAFTHPLEQKKIAVQRGVREAYRERLGLAGLDLTASDNFAVDYAKSIENSYALAKDCNTSDIDWLSGKWSDIRPSNVRVSAPETSVPIDQLRLLGAELAATPKGFDLHNGFARFQQSRRDALDAGTGINWALAEALAFASLMADGFNVRLTGQDVIRGTFTQRHLKWVDQTTGHSGMIFDQLKDVSGKLEVINSPLTEYGVLGFEYGYSLCNPRTLTMWEAQFGDFQNVAQPIIDQFIVNGEQKWNRLSGMVLSLPHGLEGGGPDHSTGRPERFLAACADGNIVVANCTTPANYFHVLRRQMIDDQRRPLVLFSPKMHLRSKAAVSALNDLAGETRFQPVIVDEPENVDKVDRVILCSGRVYFDLATKLADDPTYKIVVVRLEQLYPFPAIQIEEILHRFPNAQLCWLQEEPRNMGPWAFILDQFMSMMTVPRKLYFIGRKASASASAGSKRVYQVEQDAVIAQALRLQDAPPMDLPRHASQAKSQNQLKLQ